MKRGFAYSDVWRNAAHVLERQLTAPVQTLDYGDQIRSSRKVTIDLPKRIGSEQHTSVKVSAEAPSLLAVRSFAQFIIILFFALYFVAGYQLLMLVLDKP